MAEFSIAWIQEMISSGDYQFSHHGDSEREADNLTIDEVKEVILSGRVLEHYSDTGRGESCLVVGFTEAGKPLHVVCGSRADRLIIVTVYVPGPPKFKNPYERGEADE